MELKVTEYSESPRGLRERSQKTRIYVWPKGESVIQNLINRKIRPTKEYKKLIVQELTNRGVDMSAIRLKWSQYAGCSCPCSPGFIVDGYDPQLYRKDVHITVEGDDSGATLDQAVALLAPSPEEME